MLRFTPERPLLLTFTPARLCAVFVFFLAACGNEKNAEQVCSQQDIDSAETLHQLFVAHRKTDFKRAMDYAAQELAFSRETGYRKGIADGYSSKGYVHYYQGDYPEAQAAYLEALNVREALNDQPGIAECAYVLGKIHRSQGNIEKALEYSHRALDIYDTLGDLRGISSVLNGIGNIYMKDKKYDEAMSYYVRRPELERQLNDSGGLASALSSIADVHIARGEVQEGLEKNLQALDIIDAMQPDTSEWYLKKTRLAMLTAVAGIYHKLGDEEKAFTYALRADRDTIPNAGKEQRELYRLLAEIYTTYGAHEQAARYMMSYIAVNDSLLNEESVNAVAAMEAKYETEKKEKENAVLKLEVREEKELRNRWAIGLAAFFALLGAGGWIVHSRNKLKRQQEQFRSVIEAEENERKRIAMELHDGLGQLLSTARLNVSGVEEVGGEENRKFLENSKTLIDDACQEVRNISHNLMPAALIRLGLPAALRELAAKINSAGKLNVRLDHEQFTATLTHEAEIGLYRITQETVNNSLKYAQASTIVIHLSNAGERVFLRISDDGIGMDPQRAGKGSGIGWNNVRTRAALLNGKLEFRSGVGRGTTLELQISVNEKTNNA